MVLAHVSEEALLLVTIPSAFSAIGSIFAAKYASQASKKADQINEAVNNTNPGEPTLREAVTKNSDKVDNAQAKIEAVAEHVGAPGTEVKSENPKP